LRESRPSSGPRFYKIVAHLPRNSKGKGAPEQLWYNPARVFNSTANITCMRIATAVAVIAIVSDASAQQSASKLLNDLKSKRETLSGLHQEFESTQTFTSTHGTQTSRRQIIIDLSGKDWRERSVSGAGNRVRIFDGNDLFMIEDEDDEYIRVKRKDKDKENDPSTGQKQRNSDGSPAVLRLSTTPVLSSTCR
jgi:hypothetical protein